MTAPTQPAVDAAAGTGTATATLTVPGQAPAGSTAATGAGDAGTSTTPGTAQPTQPTAPAGPSADGVRTSTRGDDAPQQQTGAPAGGTDAGGSSVDPAAAAAVGDAGRVEDLPAWAQREIRHARQGEEQRRIAQRDLEARLAQRDEEFAAFQQKQEQLLEGVAKLFGLTGDGEDAAAGGEGAPPDPDQLTAQLGEVQQRYRERTVELAVYQAAPDLDANPKRLLDSRSFAAKVHGLDPDDGEFDAKVAEAIKAATAADPFFKADAGQAPVQPTAPSGGQFAGGPGNADPESMSVDDFRQRRRDRRPE